MPAAEKLLSLFEPHTQVIQRHKPGQPVEFGRKVWLDEVDGGIISRYALLDQPGQDQPYLADSLVGHQERFGHPPGLVAGDRGVFSAANEQLAREAGVKRIVLPATGKPSAARREQERTRWWRRGFRFRAGIEGRISVLRRDFGLDRCRDRAKPGWAAGSAGVSWRTTCARSPARWPGGGSSRRRGRSVESGGRRWESPRPPSGGNGAGAQCRRGRDRLHHFGHFAPQTSTTVPSGAC